MSFQMKPVNYYMTMVEDQPGEGYKVLSMLAEMGINLLAFNAIPLGPTQVQLTMFPEDTSKLTSEAKKTGIELKGPYTAILVQGDDELGAFAGIHDKLFKANVNVFSSNGVTDGRGSYGYVLYIKPEEFDRAVKALGV